MVDFRRRDTLMKWTLIGGAILVSIVFVWMARDRGRYVPCAECGGILDSRTGTIYSGTDLSAQRIDQPYWNRAAVTAKFETAACAPAPPDTLRADFFNQIAPNNPHLHHLLPPASTSCPKNPPVAIS